MKWLLAALFLVIGPQGWASITYATSANSGNCLQSSSTCSVTISPTSGQTGVVVIVFGDASDSVTGIADNGTGSSSYTGKRNLQFCNGGGANCRRIALWTVLSFGSGITTVTATKAGTFGSWQVVVGVYAGVNAIGATADNSNPGNNTPTISITTQDAHNYVVAGIFQRSGAYTAQNGTIRQTFNGTTAILLDNTAVSATSVTDSVTSTSSLNWGAVAAELRSAPPPSGRVRHQSRWIH